MLLWACPGPPCFCLLDSQFCFVKMLKLRMLSGEAVTSIPVEEVQDVKGLKQRLNQLHGLPTRFRQRILFRGETLKDTVMLNSPMNLDLVLLTFADVSQQQVEDLADAAEQGSVSEVGNVERVCAAAQNRTKCCSVTLLHRL